MGFQTGEEAIPGPFQGKTSVYLWDRDTIWTGGRVGRADDLRPPPRAQWSEAPPTSSLELMEMLFIPTQNERRSRRQQQTPLLRPSCYKMSERLSDFSLLSLGGDVFWTNIFKTNTGHLRFTRDGNVPCVKTHRKQVLQNKRLENSRPGLKTVLLHEGERLENQPSSQDMDMWTQLKQRRDLELEGPGPETTETESLSPAED